MAYDEHLAERIRGILGEDPAVTQKKMFGGLAFLLGGNMAVAASGQGGLMLRCDPELTDALVGHDGVARMEMRGRLMDGWIRVAPDVVATEEDLRRWVGIGADYARSLPAK